MRDFLEEQGLAKNTIFIFTTDNGTANGRNVFNAGMTGGKGSSTDGGHRVPFLRALAERRNGQRSRRQPN